MMGIRIAGEAEEMNRHLSTCRVLLALVAFVLLAALWLPPCLAYDCGKPERGCFGSCPKVEPWCMGTPPNCDCQGTQYPPGRLCNAVLQAQTTFSSTLSNSPAGPNWFTPGNSVTVTQQGGASVELHHDENWGGGTQTIAIPAGTLTATVEFTEFDGSDPNRLYFKVTALGAVLPSFASVALGGDQTGDNTFALDPSDSEGWIDMTTGEFHVQVYARFSNNIFADEPAHLQTSIDGSYDFQTSTLTLRPSADGFEDVIAQSPGDEPTWF